MNNSFIILDRDGILNKLLIDANNNTDSPMSIDQIKIFPWVPLVLKQLNDLGFKLAVATNQPAYAKGKISFDLLSQVHNHIIIKSQSKGANILSSHICFHRSEDNCQCRKPKTGLLQKAFQQHNFIPSETWMVGDRATDIIAGNSFGMKTALLGTVSDSDTNLLKQHNLSPTYQGIDLRDFVLHIMSLI